MAKRFRFRLETVLWLRQRQEEQAKRAVAEQLGRIGRVRREAGLLEDRIGQQISAMRAGPWVGWLDVMQMAGHRRWLSRLERGLLELRERLGQLQAELARQREALVEASKRAKVMQKLKDKQRARYEWMLNRQEIAETDELTAARWIHGRAERL